MPFISDSIRRGIVALLGFLWIGTTRASLDYPSIGAGLQALLTMTVTGAQLGDIVLPPSTADTLEAGICMGIPWVSAANTVTVPMINNTAGAIDPAAHIITVAVYRRAA